MTNITLKTNEIVAITISLMITAVILPLGLGFVAGAGSTVIFSEGTIGLYEGTYSFTNEEEDTAGINITFIDTMHLQDPNTNVQIKDSISSHLKVLEVYDNNSTGWISFSNSFVNQTTGTIEFWIRTTDKTKGIELWLRDNITDWAGVGFRIDNNQFYYHGAMGWDTSVHDPTVQNNVWYHVRFDFRCAGASEYMGLGENGRWTCYINGVNVPHSGYLGTGRLTYGVIRTEIRTYSADSGHYAHFDAFGYTWENYNIGDNLEDGFITYLSDLVDPIVLTVLTVLLPIFTVIGIAMFFLESRKFK